MVSYQVDEYERADQLAKGVKTLFIGRGLRLFNVSAVSLTSNIEK